MVVDEFLMDGWPCLRLSERTSEGIELDWIGGVKEEKEDLRCLMLYEALSVSITTPHIAGFGPSNPGCSRYFLGVSACSID